MLAKKEEKTDKKHKKIILFSLLFEIIRKNFKLIVRSRTSSLIVLLGPLIIIALVGTAYNTSNIYDIRLGAYSDGYSELSETLLSELGGQQFSVIKFDSSEECLNSLKASEIHVCIIIPANFESGSVESIDFNVDQSRVNLVWIVIDALSSKVSEKKTELSFQMASSLIGALGSAQQNVNSIQEQMKAFNNQNEKAL
ncbi:MAG: ABC transporter permease, partial [Nanoarchaeota archaeon]